MPKLTVVPAQVEQVALYGRTRASGRRATVQIASWSAAHPSKISGGLSIDDGGRVRYSLWLATSSLPLARQMIKALATHMNSKHISDIGRIKRPESLSLVPKFDGQQGATMKSIIRGSLSFCCALLTTAVNGACYPNKGDFDGNPDSVNVLRQNWAALSSVGLTKELKANGAVSACTRVNKGSATVRLRQQGAFGDNQRCLEFADYGIGSYDVTKSNYCKNNLYLLVLHPESASASRLYLGDTLVAQFDQNGHKTLGGTSGSSTTGSGSTVGLTAPNTTSPAPSGQGDPIQKGLGTLLKKFTGK